MDDEVYQTEWEHKKHIHDFLRERMDERIKPHYGDKNHFYINLTRHCYDVAEKEAPKHGRDEDGKYTFVELLDHIDKIIECISWSITPADKYNPGEYQGWRHIDQVYHTGKYKTNPFIDRSELESAVQTYIDGKFRTQRLDRLFVELLIAQEYFGFINDPRVNIAQYQRPLLIGWLFGRLKEALWLIGILVLVGIAYSLNWISSPWWFGVPIIFGVISTCFALWALVGYGAAYTTTRKTVQDALSGMIATYSEIGSGSGSLSTAHIHQYIQEAARKGVVWNGLLFVLMEDIEARSKTF